jgi:hypothetical protein
MGLSIHCKSKVVKYVVTCLKKIHIDYTKKSLFQKRYKTKLTQPQNTVLCYTQENIQVNNSESKRHLLSRNMCKCESLI